MRTDVRRGSKVRVGRKGSGKVILYKHTTEVQGKFTETNMKVDLTIKSHLKSQVLGKKKGLRMVSGVLMIINVLL